MPELAPLGPVVRDHLDELSDTTGIMQHAIGSRPDPAHGYCTDDVARALIVDLLHARELGWPAVARSAGTSLAFLEAAFDPRTGRFRNFRSATGRWVDGVGSEDAHARAILALGEASATAADPAVRAAAANLFERALPACLRFTYLRPLAGAVIAAEAAIRGGKSAASAAAAAALPELAAGVWRVSSTSAVGDPAWPWPERVLTYENGLIPRALLVAGRRTRDDRMIRRGLRLLDWLVSVQTAPAGHFSPVGCNGWWPYGGARARYDQQPMEATALLLAAETAFAVTDDRRHRTTMDWAYAWFLGANDGGCPVALPRRGAGQDGLTPGGANTNQGAESTLMWLIALERIRVARRSDRVRARERLSSLVGEPQLAGA